jgi:hypothetical protein
LAGVRAAGGTSWSIASRTGKVSDRAWELLQCQPPAHIGRYRGERQRCVILVSDDQAIPAFIPQAKLFSATGGSMLDRSFFIFFAVVMVAMGVMLWRMFRATSPQARHGGDRRSDDFQVENLSIRSFAEHTGDKIGPRLPEEEPVAVNAPSAVSRKPQSARNIA